MSKNRNVNGNFHTIPLQKGYVRGYYERRNGRLVWISPYENSKDKHAKLDPSSVQENPATPIVKPLKIEGGGSQNTVKPVVPTQTNHKDLNFLLEVIVRTVKTIRQFEPGEVMKLNPALKVARSIVSEMGYLDEGLDAIFHVPQVKQTKLSEGAARKTAALAKELKRVSRRVTKLTLREKTEKLSLTLAEAL